MGYLGYGIKCVNMDGNQSRDTSFLAVRQKCHEYFIIIYIRVRCNVIFEICSELLVHIVLNIFYHELLIFIA